LVAEHTPDKTKGDTGWRLASIHSHNSCFEFRGNLAGNKQPGSFFVDKRRGAPSGGFSLTSYSSPSEKQEHPLQNSDSSQNSCKPFEFPLYGNILAALLAGLITSCGGWLSGRGNRWGWIVGFLGIGLLWSILTTIGFCDPLFWRAEWRALTGQEANRCQCAKQPDYHQTFQHDGENVSQEPLDAVWEPMKALRIWKYSKEPKTSWTGGKESRMSYPQ
jgi:hypothetical protein